MKLVYIWEWKTRVRIERNWEKIEVKQWQVIVVNDEWGEVIKSTWFFKEVETTDASNKEVVKKEIKKRKEDKKETVKKGKKSKKSLKSKKK